MISNSRLLAQGTNKIPLLLTGVYLLMYFCFWTSVDVTFHQEPPIDNLEQLTWALNPAFGYSKHPPFPTWVLWIAEQAFPAGLYLTYFLGAAEVLLMLALAYLLGRASLGARSAWLGTLMITCVSYYTLRMHFYNHNTALLCAYAGSMLCTWQANATGRWRWWLLLGAAWAVGMLCKYQMAVPIVCNLFYLFVGRRGIRQLLAGLFVAAAVSTLLLVPHLVWLVQNHFPSFDYATQSLAAALSPLQRVDSVLRFLSSQLLRVVPAIVLSAMLHFLAARSPPADSNELPARGEARLFWNVHAGGPLLLMSLLSLLGGVDLEMHWGTAFLGTLPLWYLSTQRGSVLARVRMPVALATIGVVQALLIAGKSLFPRL